MARVAARGRLASTTGRLVVLDDEVTIPEGRHGTYRASDGSKVEFKAALEAWIPLAHQELLVTAQRYHAVTTSLELSKHVQERSGIRTRMLLTNWIGKLLEAVAQRAKDAGEPPLTALCVHQDGTIGPGYARAPKSTIDQPGSDVEMHAAAHRLLCYRAYATDLPADGGQPALTRQVSDRRRAESRKRRAEAPRAVCQTCFIELPANGHCDNCG